MGMARNLWDRMAKSYDKKFQTMYIDIFNLLHSKFVPSDKVIEIGCGSGLVSFKIIPEVKSFVGYDFSAEMIQVAQAKLEKSSLKNASFFVGDAFNLPTSEQYDKVLLINLLHIVDNPLKILSQSKKLVKPGGYVIVISYCHGEKMSFKYKMLSTLMRIGSAIGIMSKLQRFTFADLKSLAIQAGYSIKEEIGVKKQFPFLFLALN